MSENNNNLEQNSDSDYSKSKIMPLSRTPTSNDLTQNNVNSQDTPPNLVSDNSNNNDTINVIGNETVHEIDHRIPRSTSISYQGQNSHNRNPIDNDMQDANVYKTKSVKIICDVCQREANTNAFVCEGCQKICHPMCLREDEEDSTDPVHNSYICHICASIFKKLSNVTKKVANNSGKMSHFPKPAPKKYDLPLIDEMSRERSTKQSQSNVGSRSTAFLYPDLTNSLANNITESFYLKKQLLTLPEVTDSDMSWSVFYSSFCDTKDMFTDYENVVRVQNAIKDDTVKRIGGKGLFNMLTYVQCIENVNKRLKNNLTFLTSEAHAIENHSKIKLENKIKLVEYIDRIRNFHTMAKAYNDTSYIYNQRFLANVSDVVPFFIKNKWEAKQADMEDRGQIPTLGNMIDVFDKELPRIEASIRNDKLRGLDKKSDSKDSNKTVHRLHNITDKNKNRNSQINAEKFSNNNNENKFSCWFHKSNDHYYNNCKVLWELDGKTVSELARAFKICTFCGQKQHKPCPHTAKLKCKIEGCNFSHHSLFCFKRKPKKSSEETVNNIQTKKVDSNVDSKKASDTKLSSNSETNNKHNSEVDLENLFLNLSHRDLYTNIPDNMSDLVRESMYTKRTSHIISLPDAKNNKNSNIEPFTDRCMLGVIVIKLEKLGNFAFLIDSGSTVSLIEESIANQLGLRGPWCPLTLSWSGDQKRVDKMSRIVKLQASCITDDRKSCNLFFRTVKNLNVCAQKFSANEFTAKLPKFKSLNLFDYNEIVGILGIDNLFIFENLLTIKAQDEHGIKYLGVKCLLGDYVYGTDRPLSRTFEELNNRKLIINQNYISNHNILTESEQNELKIMEQEIMGLDYYKPKDDDKIIDKDSHTLQLLNDSVIKINNENHYTSPLLWTDNLPKLPSDDSFKLAYRRYLIVEKQALKLNRFDECIDQIKNLLVKGYAVELSEDEIINPHEKTYYNPIFFIHPPNKRTRLIWDLAAKINGKCLNDYLIPGPNLYNSLLEIIFKMRENTYLFKGDIGEMFHQIKVEENDTNALRFLFRFDPSEKIRAFKMKVLPFGAKCSPVISQFVKNKVALEFQDEYPIATEIILKNSYVDDIIASVDNKTDAIEIAVEIKKILHSGGFNFLKLNSNNSDIINGIKSRLSNEELAHEKLFCNEKLEKILGYNLNFNDDTLSLSLNICKIPDDLINLSRNPTKREVLQLLMTFFDPLGLFQFFTSKLKLLYHRVCQSKIDWDQAINEELHSIWKKYIKLIPEILKIAVPRIYCDNKRKVCKQQLWCFGDAGSDMMCGVIYVRFLDEFDEQINVRLIYAKTFVVPAKQKHTIPQLELNIASKLVIMAQEVIKMHNIKFDQIFFVTDNLPVFEWILNGAKKTSIYINNRLSKINNHSDKKQWMWVPSELMPADFGTKESSLPEFNHKNSWFLPDLFRLPERNWTFKSNIEHENLNINNAMSFDEEDNILDAKKCSKLRTIISFGQIALKWKLIVERNKLKLKMTDLEKDVLKDIHNRSLKNNLHEFKEKLKSINNDLSNRTLNYCYVENLIIKLAQLQSFEFEINLLKDGKSLPKNNRIYKLLPFFDENGILRAKSRIGNNEKNLITFGYDRICPIILSKSHELTKLYILNYHSQNHHMLNNSVIINLLKRFHIPHIKATVNNVIRQNCYVCKRKNATPEVPLMGNLPGYRLAYHSKPFSYCIIDLAGPILVKNYRGRDIKRWIFVYSCLTTRAVHLELLEDLTSNSTLIALQNVINLRGKPLRILTDSGTNFTGAQSILNEAQNVWNDELLKLGIIVKPIEWDFAPAKAPHMQGAVERLVGLVKNALKKMIHTLNQNSKRYNDFQLRAILYEITGLLNNRPLSMIPIEGSFNEFLTPNHFLIGSPTIQTTPIGIEKFKNLHDYWIETKVISNILWKHWLSAYIPLIMMREKWFDKKSPLKVDDIVIIADPSVASSWRMGRVIEIKEGSEGQVRSVTIIIGKHKKLDVKINKSNKSYIMKLYKEERQSIVTRPAISVAKLHI